MRSHNSKFVFALLLLALIVGWVYMVFVPSHNVKKNLELNANYFPGITEVSVKNK